MKKDILNSIDETTNELLESISLFNQEQFNKVPFEGSWTAAQVAEHIYKSESGIPKIWRGNSVETQRPVDEKAGILHSIFLDFETKLKSPEFILPSTEIQQIESLYNSLKSNRAEIRNLAESINLNLTFTDFSFPQLGELTGVEWVTFFTCHSKRHTRQINNIFELIK